MATSEFFSSKYGEHFINFPKNPWYTSQWIFLVATLRNFAKKKKKKKKKKTKHTTEVIIGCDDGEIGSHEGAESLMACRRRHRWACNSLPVFVFLMDDAHRKGHRRQKSCFESA
jgi:hypothetical protein